MSVSNPTRARDEANSERVCRVPRVRTLVVPAQLRVRRRARARLRSALRAQRPPRVFDVRGDRREPRVPHFRAGTLKFSRRVPRTVGEASTAAERFATAVARGPDLDLAEAALLIALEEYPTLSIPAYLEKLDDMALEARDRIRPDAPVDDRIDSLNAYVFDALGFKGNAEDYYDPRNSFLNEVIDRRLGLPITLSLGYLEVARRVGLPPHR